MMPKGKREMAKTKTVKYTVTAPVLYDQPSATKSTPAPGDGIVKVSGTITKDGAAQKTPHKIILHRQMPQFVKTWKVNGNVATFSLTETTKGRGKDAPTEKAVIDSILSRYAEKATEK